MSSKKKISLTGVKPTGMPHWGNYFGAIKPAIELANDPGTEGYYFIADYHTLNSIHDPKVMNDYIYDVAATWMALGLDPEKITFYKQSDIPEILELNWILNCFTSKGLMNRAHAYKAKVQENIDNKKDEDYGVNIGLYCYPILMAADILFIESDIVPVGADQVQHVEIARDIATVFNSTYGEVFKLPVTHVKEPLTLKGVDGRKMSKSYNNHIPLFLPEKKLKKTINKITTDSLPPEAPKDPSDSLIYYFYEFFANEDQKKELADRYKAGIGWGEAKLELFNLANELFAEPREKYDELIANKKAIDEILNHGKDVVRPKAQSFLSKVKKACGVC